MKIYCAQINPTVGDFQGNVARIQVAMDNAASVGAHLLVLPELALCGYYPGDLLDNPRFIQAHDEALAKLQAYSSSQPNLAVVLGVLGHNDKSGKPLHNSLVLIENGQIQLTYHKQLLPTYNVFDERRHFEPGPRHVAQWTIQGVRVGFLICEDGWNDTGLDYEANPLRDVAGTSDLVVSLNASPSNWGKAEQRAGIFTEASRRYAVPILYVNQVGGQDQLVFDGHSFAVTPVQGVVFEAASFVEVEAALDFENGVFQGTQCLPPYTKSQLFYNQIKLGLGDYMRRTGFQTAVVGCSGGIDSALTLALAVDTLGAQNVTAITMPSMYSSSGSVDDSQVLCKNLGITLYQHPMGKLTNEFSGQFAAKFAAPLQGIALENVQARIRAVILMEYSNQFGAMLLTTGNKSELSVGYSTIYGDLSGGLGLIGDLYKMEVYGLSRYINELARFDRIPVAIIEKAPSAELAPGQKDTDSLPSYPILDAMLQWYIEGSQKLEDLPAEVLTWTRSPSGSAQFKKVINLVHRSEYKRRQAPPVIRVRPRAFGTGRQIPVTASYTFE